MDAKFPIVAPWPGPRRHIRRSQICCLFPNVPPQATPCLSESHSSLWGCGAVPWPECLCPPPSDAYIESLMPKVLVLGGGACGRGLGQENGARMSGTSALIKETTEHPSSSHHVGHSARSAACSLQASPGLAMPAPRSYPSEPRTLRNGSVVSDLPVCSVLLQQPERTEAGQEPCPSCPQAVVGLEPRSKAAVGERAACECSSDGGPVP